MPCSFDCLSDFALELQGSSGEPAGKDFSLLVEETFQELCVLVVDIFDVRFLEAAVFLLIYLYCRRVEISDFVVCSPGLFLLFLSNC